MKKDVLIAGLLGGLTILIWLFISNAVLRIKSDMIHKVMPNQQEVHRILKENITETGTYSCPYLPHYKQNEFPDYRNQPVFSITYTGYTHDSGSGLDVIIPLIVIFLTTLIVSWMLSITSQKFLSKYWRKILFVAIIGLIIAMHENILQMFFGPQAKDYLIFLAINNIITWTLAGLVIAWRIKPVKA